MIYRLRNPTQNDDLIIGNHPIQNRAIIMFDTNNDGLNVIHHIPIQKKIDSEFFLKKLKIKKS